MNSQQYRVKLEQRRQIQRIMPCDTLQEAMLSLYSEDKPFVDGKNGSR